MVVATDMNQLRERAAVATFPPELAAFVRCLSFWPASVNENTSFFPISTSYKSRIESSLFGAEEGGN